VTPSAFSLEGRLALVTGASRGIGRSLAIGLAQAGADIVAAARSADALAETVAAVEATGRRAVAHTVDVSSVASIDRLFDTLAGENLVPDILVNNAGTEEVRPSLDVDEALWDRIVDTNLKGAFFTARRFAAALLASGRGGAIINLGSLASEVGIPTAGPYTASKSGVLGMTRVLASEWAARGIRVNALGPGYFRTAMTEPFYQDADWQRGMLARIPAGRFGELDDLTGAAVFLASDAARYVTGQMLYVDGGYMAAL